MRVLNRAVARRLALIVSVSARRVTILARTIAAGFAGPERRLRMISRPNQR
jgi:hypothetical protein